MHIPDGYIPLWECGLFYIILIIALGLSLNWARKKLDDKYIPLIAILGIGIFAIMSMNIPTPLGASGHMVGGALVAILFLAPEAAILIFTIVLLIQALLFGDGGITVLGLNVFNMGIIGGCVGLFTFKGLRKYIGDYPSIAVGAWLATVLAACACAIELAIGGTFPLKTGLTLMCIYHIPIGIIEAVLTVIVIKAIDTYRPDLIPWTKTENKIKTKKNRIITVAIIICLIICCLAPFIASSDPDGLEKTAEDLGVTNELSVINSPLPDYSIDSLGSIGGIIALIIGVIVVLAICFGFSKYLKRRRI